METEKQNALECLREFLDLYQNGILVQSPVKEDDPDWVIKTTRMDEVIDKAKRIIGDAKREPAVEPEADSYCGVEQMA